MMEIEYCIKHVRYGFVTQYHWREDGSFLFTQNADYATMFNSHEDAKKAALKCFGSLDDEYVISQVPIVKKKPRGFATISPERRREIASMGGKAAQSTGKAHRFNSQSGKSAGIKGGTKVSEDRAHMAKIGAIGAANKAKRSKNGNE